MPKAFREQIYNVLNAFCDSKIFPSLLSNVSQYVENTGRTFNKDNLKLAVNELFREPDQKEGLVFLKNFAYWFQDDVNESKEFKLAMQPVAFETLLNEEKHRDYFSDFITVRNVRISENHELFQLSFQDSIQRISNFNQKQEEINKDVHESIHELNRIIEKLENNEVVDDVMPLLNKIQQWHASLSYISEHKQICKNCISAMLIQGFSEYWNQVLDNYTIHNNARVALIKFHGSDFSKATFDAFDDIDNSAYALRSDGYEKMIKIADNLLSSEESIKQGDGSPIERYGLFFIRGLNLYFDRYMPFLLKNLQNLQSVTKNSANLCKDNLSIDQLDHCAEFIVEMHKTSEWKFNLLAPCAFLSYNARLFVYDYLFGKKFSQYFDDTEKFTLEMSDRGGYFDMFSQILLKLHAIFSLKNLTFDQLVKIEGSKYPEISEIDKLVAQYEMFFKGVNLPLNLTSRPKLFTYLNDTDPAKAVEELHYLARATQVLQGKMSVDVLKDSDETYKSSSETNFISAILAKIDIFFKNEPACASVSNQSNATPDNSLHYNP